MIRMHNVHPATHYDSSATKRTQEEVMRSRQVTVYARQHPRYRKYRQSTEAAQTLVGRYYMTQKFKRGTKVRIADDLGPCKRHFPRGQTAYVDHTYKERYNEFCRTGDGNDKIYSLYLIDKAGKAYDTSAWYDEHELTELESDEMEFMLAIKDYIH